MSLHPFAMLRSVIFSLQKNPKSTWFWASLPNWLNALLTECSDSDLCVPSFSVQNYWCWYTRTCPEQKNVLQGPTNPTLQGEDVRHCTHMLSPVHLCTWQTVVPAQFTLPGSHHEHDAPHKLGWGEILCSTLLTSTAHMAVGENTQLLSRGCNSRPVPASWDVYGDFSVSLPLPACWWHQRVRLGK